MLSCFLCNGTDQDVLTFNTYNFGKCHRMSQFRKAKNFKYAEVVMPESISLNGYHVTCYRKFVVLKEKYRKDYEKMFDIVSKPSSAGEAKVCVFCNKSELKEQKLVHPIYSCSRKVRDVTKNQAEKLGDRDLLFKIERGDHFDYHPICRSQFVVKYRKHLADCYNYSMPLQQRLTAIATTSTAPEQEKPIPTLKSQPLSPTKLKVTRQSAKPQSQPQPKPAEEQVHSPVKEEVCLKWNTHHSNMQTAFPVLLNKEQYCDVTLLAEGMSLKCHKLILSSCSAYFDQVLEKVEPYQHPIIFLKDIPFNIIKALCDFMYVGEVNILNSDLDQILAVGESLKIKGLANKSEINNTTKNLNTSEPPKVPVKPSKATAKPPVPEKNDTANDAEITDPLDLMEPTYEEAATPDIPPPVLKRNDQTRKSTGKRIRKRKHVEVDHEPSPPVFRMRKGTRSRPNVKVPRYFNANFDNSAPAPVPEPSEFMASNATEEFVNDPFMNILDQIKTEPLDIEDNVISFEEETFIDEMSNREHDAEEYEPSPRIEEPEKVLKKRRSARYSAVAKQEKPDPLNFDHNIVIERQEDEMQLDTCERIESQEENNDRDERLDMQVESCERDEMPTEDIGKGENIDSEELNLQNSDLSLVENNSAEEMQLENSEYEERLVEDIDREDNFDQKRTAEVSDRDNTGIENSEKEETQGDNTHIREIQMNNTYREQTSLADGDEVLAAVSEGNETSVENNEEETNGGNTDTQVIQNENIHTDLTEGQEITNDDRIHENRDEDTKQGESSCVEESHSAGAGGISENFLEEGKTAENNGSIGMSENAEDVGNSEEKLNSIEDESPECNSEGNKLTLKENSLDEVSTLSTEQEGCNSNLSSKKEEDPLL